MNTRTEITPTLPMIQALNDCLNSIKTRHPEVGNIVLVVGASSGTKHGHFAPLSWDGNRHEIMISGESLARGAEATLATLLHESAHVIAFTRGIKDTSRQNRFHNTKFRALAEEVGIEVAHDSSIGWSITTLPAATARTYHRELVALGKAIKTFRVGFAGAATKKPTEKRTIKLGTASGRTLTVPISFHEAGDFFDAETGEMFYPLEP